MIPNETLQVVETLGPSAQVGNFRITDATQARILVSLSDKMYTRKELAVIREYSTNCADAHIVVDKLISDIQVSLPTMEDLNFRIRDFGTGLTETEIRDVYCVFGESTKRNSNKLNGVLGYGCKAGFAHADSFTVTSWIDSIKTVYQCIKGDSTKLHSSLRLSREDSNEPSGIEICVPVKQNSWYTFHREAIAFYRCWPTMPTIKGLSDDDAASLAKFRSTPATLMGRGWEVRPTSDGAHGVAYMGWVPYAIDWNVLQHKMSLDSKSRALFELLRSNDVILYFEMGEIQFVDSRESLEYTDKTFNVIVTRIKEIFDCIKDSIQKKFTGLPSLWDAKIMYNAIFGTGVLELEKGETDSTDVTKRIKILDGNLMQLERTFQDSFTWKGVILKSPSFVDINRFDNDNVTELFSDGHEPSAPVMVTYRKKKNRVKANRCKADSNNKIVASNRVAVVYNDTGRKTGQQMAARYLIFGAPKTYTTIYVLSFTEKSLKDLFIKEYNFETVPIIKLSDLLPETRIWHKTNKVSRNYGGGGEGTRAMQYLDLDSGTLEDSEVPVREIEEGAFYIGLDSVTRRSRRRSGSRTYHLKTTNTWGSIEAKGSIADFKKIIEELDLDVDRIYIISSKTIESKWFKQALESGDWTNIWTLIKENMGNLTLDVSTMVDAENYESTPVICKEAADLLLPMVMDKNSTILKLIATASNKDYDRHIEIKNVFESLSLWDGLKGENKGTIDFEASVNAAKMAYPFLNWDDLENDYRVTPEKIVAMTKYINMADMYEKFLAEKMEADLNVDCSVVLSDNCPFIVDTVIA